MTTQIELKVSDVPIVTLIDTYDAVGRLSAQTDGRGFLTVRLPQTTNVCKCTEIFS